MDTMNSNKDVMDNFLYDADCGIVMIDDNNVEKFMERKEIINHIQYDNISDIHIIDDNTLHIRYDDKQYILEMV